MRSLAFIIIGLTVGVLTIFILLNSGFIVGFNKNKSTLNEKPLVQNIPSTTPNPTSTSLASVNPTPSGNLVIAGGKLSFVKYTLILPTAWTYSKESPASEMETVLLSNGGYSITINQAASEGGKCTYNQNNAPNAPFTTNYKFYKELKTQDSTVLRRGGESANSSIYTVCAYSSQNANYQQPTQYGYTSVKTPANPAAAMLQEIDQILSSLKKI